MNHAIFIHSQMLVNNGRHFYYIVSFIFMLMDEYEKHWFRSFRSVHNKSVWIMVYDKHGWSARLQLFPLELSSCCSMSKSSMRMEWECQVNYVGFNWLIKQIDLLCHFYIIPADAPVLTKCVWDMMCGLKGCQKGRKELLGGFEPFGLYQWLITED